MTEIREAAEKMFREKSVERMEKMKRLCRFLALLLVASVALNLAFVYHHVKGGSGCAIIESLRENMLQWQFDPRSTLLLKKVTLPTKNPRSYG